MSLRNTISSLLKTLACLAFVFALVVSPSSASHAASGMHGEHHASADLSADHGQSTHVHGQDRSTGQDDRQAYASEVDAKDKTSAQCCGDMCVSAVLDESRQDLSVQTTGGKYLMLHAQTASIEPSGFLRPPQSLI